MMFDQIDEIIRENDICVLATAGADGPHTSLMSYACSADRLNIYLATPQNTLKYRNLCVQPRVSVMVDTRDKDPRGKMRALTINGCAIQIHDIEEAGAVRTMLLDRHPHLQRLLAQPGIAFIRIAIEAVQMLDGPLAAYHIRFSPGTRG